MLMLGRCWEFGGLGEDKFLFLFLTERINVMNREGAAAGGQGKSQAGRGFTTKHPR